MKTVIFLLIGFSLVSCVSTEASHNQTVIEKQNSQSKINMTPLSSLQNKCKEDILCEYLSWFDKSTHEIKALQKEYGISYELPEISLDKNFTTAVSLLNDAKNLKKIVALVRCDEENINQIVYNQNKFLFICKVSAKDEFRYGVYFGNINKQKLRLYPIDSGGGEVAETEAKNK